MLTSGTAAPFAGPIAGRSTTLAFAITVLLLLALQFGQAIGLVAFRLTADPLWALNGALRDGAVIALALVAAANLPQFAGRAVLPASARWAVATLLAFALFGLLSSSGVFVTALNLRRLGLSPLLFLAILLVPWTPRQIDRLFSLVIGTSVVVALLGLGERLAPDWLWTDVLEIGAYTAANGFDRFGGVAFEQSGRFFSSDLTPWVDAPVRRMVSTYLEPTTLAAAMAALLTASLARRARGWRASTLVLLAALCGLATLSKGFALFLVVLLGWRTFGVPSPRHVLALSAVVCATAMAFASLRLEGPLAHVDGLATSLHYLAQGNLAGEGVGNAGNYTNADVDVGSESGLGNAIAQVGLAALLPLFWASALGRDILKAATARHDPGGAWMASWVVFWVVTYLGSASSLGVGGNALGFMMLALYLHPGSGVRSATMVRQA